jgi:hypothetical protein
MAFFVDWSCAFHGGGENQEWLGRSGDEVQHHVKTGRGKTLSHSDATSSEWVYRVVADFAMVTLELSALLEASIDRRFSSRIFGRTSSGHIAS